MTHGRAEFYDTHEQEQLKIHCLVAYRDVGKLMEEGPSGRFQMEGPGGF